MRDGKVGCVDQMTGGGRPRSVRTKDLAHHDVAVDGGIVGHHEPPDDNVDAAVAVRVAQSAESARRQPQLRAQRTKLGEDRRWHLGRVVEARCPARVEDLGELQMVR